MTLFDYCSGKLLLLGLQTGAGATGRLNCKGFPAGWIRQSKVVQTPAQQFLPQGHPDFFYRIPWKVYGKVLCPY